MSFHWACVHRDCTIGATRTSEMLEYEAPRRVIPPDVLAFGSSSSSAHSSSNDVPGSDVPAVDGDAEERRIAFGWASWDFLLAKSCSSKVTRGLRRSERSSVPLAENAMTGGSSVSPDVTTKPPPSISTTW